MRKRKAGRKFGRETSQRSAMMSHLATALVLNGKIRTTEAKARELRPYAEKLISRARTSNLAARREVAKILPPAAVKILMNDIAPRMVSRSGGYTRLTKLPPRRSDGSPQAIIEIL